MTYSEPDDGRFDLIVKGGKVFDPGQVLNGNLDIAFKDGLIARIAPDIPVEHAQRVQWAKDALVVPGLIDMHTHVYSHGSSLSIEAETSFTGSGTTTFVDAGSTGAGNLPGFVHHVIRKSTPRVFAFVNIAFPGIYAFSKDILVGEGGDARLLHAAECVRVARQFASDVVGVKARVGLEASGGMGIAPLEVAIEAAEELGLPVMAHIDFPPPRREDVLALLRPGDIYTHCFRPFPNAPIDGDGRLRECVIEARERGVLFDVGHGKGGFAFHSGMKALEQGFAPDLISSDVHVLSVKELAPDVLTVMNKFWAMGMPLEDIVTAATRTPAAVLRRPDLGCLRVGASGDLTLLHIEDGRFEYSDAAGETMTADRRLVSIGCVIGGKDYMPSLARNNLTEKAMADDK